MDGGPMFSRFGLSASLQRNGKDEAVVFVFEQLISVIGMKKEHVSMIGPIHATGKWLERQVSQESCH